MHPSIPRAGRSAYRPAWGFQRRRAPSRKESPTMTMSKPSIVHASGSEVVTFAPFEA